jgi:hypothetical protein
VEHVFNAPTETFGINDKIEIGNWRPKICEKLGIFSVTTLKVEFFYFSAATFETSLLTLNACGF